MAGGVACAHVRLTARGRQLVVGALVERPASAKGIAGDDGFQIIATGVVQQFVGAPDAANASDRTLTQPQVKRGVVGVFLGGAAAAALAAAADLAHTLAQLVVFQPEHVAADNDGAVHTRNVGAVSAGLHAQVRQARAVVANTQTTYQRAACQADASADQRAGRPAHQKADSTTNYSTENIGTHAATIL